MNDNDDGLSETYVYLLVTFKKDDEPGPVKVGIGSKPTSRVKQIATSSPYKVELAAAIMLPTREIARLVERAFHEVFKQYRMSGEWFDMDPADAAWGLCSGVREMIGIMPISDDLRSRMWDSTGVRAFAASIGWETFPASPPPAH